ncbi:MAG: 50S ribosomal protein L4 [Ignavibacteria bacterium]|nr:50S ribosomal protein L4 [Ignavibacteria bacterium]
MEFNVYKIDGTVSTEKVQLLENVFNADPNDHAIYLAVKRYLANQRQGTSKAKERAEVNGGGKKPWKQKGRGGARAGTSRSPVWVGGGTIFGPKPRDHRQKLPKKVGFLAKVSALSYKVADQQFVVVEDFSFDKPETKKFAALLDALKLTGKKVLLLTGKHDEIVYKSGRNIDRCFVQEVKTASTYDLLNNQILVVQKSAVEYLNSAYGDKVKEVANA